jgi:hypothetical protein
VLPVPVPVRPLVDEPLPPVDEPLPPVAEPLTFTPVPEDSADPPDPPEVPLPPRAPLRLPPAAPLVPSPTLPKGEPELFPQAAAATTSARTPTHSRRLLGPRAKRVGSDFAAIASVATSSAFRPYFIFPPPICKATSSRAGRNIAASDRNVTTVDPTPISVNHRSALNIAFVAFLYWYPRKMASSAPASCLLRCERIRRLIAMSLAATAT